MADHSKVRVWQEKISLPTFLPAPPDKNPMFLEKRVYQGSSGKVYPLPFTDRIADEPVDRKWQGVWIENEFLRVLVLPEIGGRIHRIQDKSNGYELVYNQPVIKPALVGLAGPWISGGIEFNWPQHHRPATFMPVEFRIEEDADGSKTVWCSDHDPMCRMKGMHGVCLHPGKSYVEVKVRAYNRTPLTQTFLWWANAATRVHEGYQSFFPPDVHAVADHARRSMSEYPLAQGSYYGVRYGQRSRRGIPTDEVPAQFVPPHCAPAAPGPGASEIPGYAPNDLSFYANIPVPTSYMCVGSKEDFCGGYDHRARAGIVHIANHHISPGKKQWTWGNHEFGYAWDRNLTEPDEKGEFGPYIELMAGVYTDNQPDFSFLHPGETKTWRQFWYPIREIGPARHANLDAALSLRLEKGRARLGVAVTSKQEKVRMVLTAKGKRLAVFTAALAPGAPLVKAVKLPRGVRETDVRVLATDRRGDEIIAYQARSVLGSKAPLAATEPLPPESILGNDELFITGLHLAQYRHATRCPTTYWLEALRRDPLDARCNNAMGLWHLRRGEFAEAEKHFRAAIARLTRRNQNPYDGEPFYNLGLTLRYLGREAEAYDAFYKSIWNQAWVAPGHHALAEIDCARRNWNAALEHLDRSLACNTDNLRARNLKVIVLRRLHRNAEAAQVLRESLALDPLDPWARTLDGQALACDAQTVLDVAHDCARSGLYQEAIQLLQTRLASTGIQSARDGATRPTQTQRERLRNGSSSGAAQSLASPAADPMALADQSWGALPLLEYTLGWLHEQSNDRRAAAAAFRRGAALPPDYCFPARLEEIAVFEAALRVNQADARAPYYLGNLLYDRRRHDEATRMWERAARLDPDYAVVWRNLGIAYFNVAKSPRKARAAYDRAFQANPEDARLLYERDQLWKRLGEPPARRLRKLERNPELVAQRDDLTVELCALLNHAGRHADAEGLLASRRFHPWEGGEGGLLGQHVRTQCALGQEALARADYGCAAQRFKKALAAPENLGEARHLLANQSDVHYWAGVANHLLGEKARAKEHWLRAAKFKGDFQGMSVRVFSEMTYYSALAWERLGRKDKKDKLLHDLLAYAVELQKAPAKIDYFATSLPTMLLFDDDLKFRQDAAALFLQAQARLGLGQPKTAARLLQEVLRRDPSHALGSDFAAGLLQGKGKR